MMDYLGFSLVTVLIVLGIYSFICGVFSSALAEEKGWSGITFFFVGFIFGILGLIYAAGLPVHKESKNQDTVADLGFPIAP